MALANVSIAGLKRDRRVIGLVSFNKKERVSVVRDRQAKGKGGQSCAA
jgi:hypothetical protein